MFFRKHQNRRYYVNVMIMLYYLFIPTSVFRYATLHLKPLGIFCIKIKFADSCKYNAYK